MNILKSKILSLISIIFRQRVKNYQIIFNNLNGKDGLEIGGPSKLFKKKNILPIYPICENLDNCCFSDKTVWAKNQNEGQTYNFFKNKKGEQFISDAVDLNNIASKTYDFVLSSHVLEHIANPIKALTEWIRILKDEGHLLLILPHKDGTFDHTRPTTTLKHLINDANDQIKEDDLSHLDEILKLHDLKLDPRAGGFESFKKRSLINIENRCLHHHCFNTELAIQLINHVNLQIISVDVALPYHIIIFAKKLNQETSANNNFFLKNDAEFKSKSPFASDKI